MYKRVLLKISGEALRGKQEFGVSPEACADVAAKIGAFSRQGHELAIVIGGGNIFRGIQQGPDLNVRRVAADQIGMLATLINGIALKEALLKAGFDARILSAIECPDIAEKYQWEKAQLHLEEGRILLFVCGTGHPFFTTDTAAALRASEIKADILLKATTRVDGVYDKDPMRFPDAKKYDHISYSKVLEQKLGILDLSAITLCMNAKVPIQVFNFNKNSLEEAVSDHPVGTRVGE